MAREERTPRVLNAPPIYAVRCSPDGSNWIVYAPPGDVPPSPPWERALARPSVNMAHSWGVWVWYYIETRIEDNRMGLWAHIEPESVACGAQCST
jgi:hypothetical protein